MISEIIIFIIKDTIVNAPPSISPKLNILAKELFVI